jgi:hypothetical protein
MMLELKAYQDFRSDFKAGKFGTQRFGQAFHDHFKLHKSELNNNPEIQKLYEQDGEEAVETIKQLVDFEFE